MPHNALSADSSSSPSPSFATGSLGRRLSAVLLSVLTLGLVGSAIGGWSLQRIHRSTIVNLDNVKSVKPHTNGECFLVSGSGTQVKVSRSYRDVVARFL